MKLSFFSRLQVQQSFLIITLVLVPLLIVVFVIINRMSAEAQTQTLNQLEVIATLKHGHILQWLSDAQAVLGMIVNDDDATFMREALENDIPNSQTVMRVNQNLATFDQKETIFNEFFVYNRQGNVIVASDELEIGKNTRLQPYFQTSLLTDTIHPPYYDVSKNDLVLVITRVLYNDKNEVIGVLAGDVNITTMSQIIGEHTDFHQTDETILVSRESGYFLTPSRFKGYSRTRQYSSYAIDQVLQGHNGSGVHDDYRNPPVRVVEVYHWIPELQAGLIAKIDEAEAIANFTTARNEALWVAALASLVALLLGLHQANLIVAPIVRLTQTAQLAAQGKFTEPISTHSTNEIGVLTTVFNHMLQQVQQLVADLSAKNAALQEAMTVAQAANTAKSEFLTTMSHELRTPLNAILGFSEVLMLGLDGELPPQAQQDAQLIYSNGEHLLALVNDVLDISKIEAGLIEIAPEPLSLNETIETVLTTMETVVEAQPNKRNKVILETMLPPHLPQVYADPIRLKQILLNLVENSVKFTEYGRIQINAIPMSRLLEVSIKDTGIGIPREMHQKIFDSFTQVDMSSTRRHGGTGLGLSICKHLVTLHGGTIWVESEVGQGTTVHFTLPIYEASFSAA